MNLVNIVTLVIIKYYIIYNLTPIYSRYQISYIPNRKYAFLTTLQYFNTTFKCFSMLIL